MLSVPLIVFASLYLLAVFVTGRVLGRKAVQREEACVADKNTKCVSVCKSLGCIHGHYLPVLACLIPPLPWLYWLSGYIIDLPRYVAAHRNNKELAALRHKHAMQEEQERHDLVMARIAAERVSNGLPAQFSVYADDQR